MRYFFHIAYNGSHYNGWQKHPKAHSVQEVIEKKLSEVFKLPLTINGCGRTDAKVHASQYFFHVDIEPSWDFDLVFRLNKLLPHNIAVFEVIPVAEKAHARFDAVQREYSYYLHTYKDAFLSQLSSFYLLPHLNINEMARAAALLPNYTDYRAFCTSPDKYDHTLCYVKQASIAISPDEKQLRFHITANRFLTRMIRIIMAKLLLIGQGLMSVDEFEDLLRTCQIPSTLEAAHPTGLYLSKISYPYLNIPAQRSFCGVADLNWVRL
ncbi:tRNA pseudouridine synthase A [compost metagenome]